MSFLKAHLKTGSKSDEKAESQTQVEAQAEVDSSFFDFMPEDANEQATSKDNLLEITEQQIQAMD